jgi:hypothetical protein
MGSPEQRRTPAAAAPLAASAATVPLPSNQSRGPVTFGGQTYHNLPPHLAAQVAATASLSAAPQPSTSFATAMPPPLNPNSSKRAVTFGGQTYHNLPPHLAAQLAAVAPLPAAPQYSGGHRYPSIAFHTPIPISAPTSASTSTVPPQHYRRRPATSLLAPAPVSFYFFSLIKALILSTLYNLQIILPSGPTSASTSISAPATPALTSFALAPPTSIYAPAPPPPISAFTSTFAVNLASSSRPLAPAPALAPTSALTVSPQNYRRRPATSLLTPAPVSFYYVLLLKY